jgi:hypothetical protein
MPVQAKVSSKGFSKDLPVAGRAKVGQPHRKMAKRLERRRKDFATISDKHPTGSFHFPGSLK